MSQRAPIEETIDGIKFTMYMLPPLKSHNLLMDVAKMVGPTLGAVFDSVLGGAKNVDMDKELGPEFFSRAASSLFSNINKSVLEEVISAFKEITFVGEGAPLTKEFDIFFMGKLDLMYKWLLWGMKAQWGKSFAALINLASDQGGMMPQQLKSPTT